MTDSHDPLQEIGGEVGSMLRGGLAAAAAVGQAAMTRQADRDRQTRQQADDERRAIEQRATAEHQSAALLYGRVGSEAWWSRATAPQVADAWRAAAGWEGRDVKAGIALDEIHDHLQERPDLRSQLADQYGLRFDDHQAQLDRERHEAEAVDLLTATDPLEPVADGGDPDASTQPVVATPDPPDPTVDLRGGSGIDGAAPSSDDFGADLEPPSTGVAPVDVGEADRYPSPVLVEAAAAYLAGQPEPLDGQHQDLPGSQFEGYPSRIEGPLSEPWTNLAEHRYLDEKGAQITQQEAEARNLARLGRPITQEGADALEVARLAAASFPGGTNNPSGHSSPQPDVMPVAQARTQQASTPAPASSLDPDALKVRQLVGASFPGGVDRPLPTRPVTAPRSANATLDAARRVASDLSRQGRSNDENVIGR